MYSIREELWARIIADKDTADIIDDVLLLRAFGTIKCLKFSGLSLKKVQEFGQHEYPGFFISDEDKVLIDDEGIRLFAGYSLYEFVSAVLPLMVGDKEGMEANLNFIASNEIERAYHLFCVVEVNRKMREDNVRVGDIEQMRFTYYQDLPCLDKHRIPKTFFVPLYEAVIYYPLSQNSILSDNEKERLDKLISATGLGSQDLIGILREMYKDRNYLLTVGTEDSIETGIRSPKERNKLIQSIGALYNQNPLKIMAMLTEQDKKDHSLENGFVLDRIRSFIGAQDERLSVVIIDPSLEFILKILDNQKMVISADYTVVLSDRPMAEYISNALSSKDKRLPIKNNGNLAVIDIETWNNRIKKREKLEYDLIVYFGNHFSVVEQNIWLTSIVQSIYKPATVISLISSNVSGAAWNPVQDVFDERTNNKYNVRIENIDLIPQNITGSSSPRRKMLLTHSIGITTDHPMEINCYYLRVDSDGNEKLMRDNNGPVYVAQKEIPRAMSEIRKFYVGTIRERTTGENGRNRPLKYSFTNEIEFWYNVMPYRGDRPKIKAYICRPATEKQKNRTQHNPMKRGKIIRESEKTTGRYSHDSIELWLESVYPFETVGEESSLKESATNQNEAINIRNVISQYIRAEYEGRDISLKTFWYIYPELALEMGSSYGDFEKAAKSDLGWISLSEITENNCSAYVSLYEQNLKKVRKCVGAIAVAMDKAVEKGHISESTLINELVEKEKSSGRNPIAEIRDAIGKRDFTYGEAKQIYEIINDEIHAGNIEYIGVLIRLMRGIDSNTICGLRFKDVERLDDYTDVQAFNLNHQVINDGSMEKGYTTLEDYRSVPVPDCVVAYIDTIREQMSENLNMSKREIDNCHILMTGDCLVDKDKAMKQIFAPRELERLSADVIKKIGLEDSIISVPDDNGGTKEINLIKYGGDIFRNNFRNRVLSEAGLIEDEINYLLGNKPVVTFYRYYCDFNSHASLLGIAQKLKRWDVHFYGNEPSGISRVKKNMIKKSVNEISKNKDTVDIYPREIVYELGNHTGKSIINIKNNYGMDIEVTRIDQR